MEMEKETDRETIKDAECINPVETLKKLVESTDKETAASLMMESLKYFLAKKDEIAEIVKDINQFLKQNKELVVLLDPAVMVSVSLRDLAASESLEDMLKGPGSHRDYAFEAALGRDKNLKAACCHIKEQLDS